MPRIKTTTPVAGSKILGIGGTRGELIVTNDDLVGPIDSSDEWIRQRTGIITRRRAGRENTIVDLATVAGKSAVEAAGLEPVEIDVVIVASVSWMQATPGMSPIVAANIGASPDAAAFDTNVGCAGYCYGIGVADSLIRSGQARHVLVVGAEKLSDYADPTDRSISFLLGDGAGAAVLGPSETPQVGPTIWGTDGTKADKITMTHDWLAYKYAAPGQTPEWPTARQEGQAVYKWAVFTVPRMALAAVAAAGIEPSDIEVFIPHQANLRIIDSMVKRLGLPEDVVVAKDIIDTGNTSSASVPLATERLLREGRAKSGQIALQFGFGAGLSYAAQVVILP